MEENKKISRKDFLMIALIACIVSLSIAYATISTTLNITNNLMVKAQDWDIHFEKLELQSITEGNDANVTSPAVIENDTTKISGLKVIFKKPGDSVSYTFDVKNAGGIDAKLSSIVIGTPTCNPENAVCDNLEYSLKYANGDNINVDDILNAGDSVKLKLTIKYKLSSAQIFNSDINVSGLDATLVYSQK